jgi:NitT/TauT family transport system substrate-binding protein
MRKGMRQAAGALFALAVWSAPALAQDTVILSSVGSTSANGWPSYVAIEKGFFAAEGIKPDVVFAQSNASVIQQLAAGSTNVSTNSGLVDPIRAIEKGAPLALLRIEVQKPPYAVLAKSSIKTVKDLKGKTISIGGAKDITRIFVERMLTAHGLQSGDYDLTFAGATSARFAALQAGAVDAAILTPPFNFHAESAGFINLGNTVDYADMPFAGIAVNTAWANANRKTVEKIVGIYTRSIAWLYDPKNREEAVTILMRVSNLKKDDVERAYDFLIPGRYFEPTGKISKARIGALVDALKTLGDVPATFTVDRLFLANVTQVAD